VFVFVFVFGGGKGNLSTEGEGRAKDQGGTEGEFCWSRERGRSYREGGGLLNHGH
jgi:hypothetical protein